jgi:hypothetical protein
MVPVLHHSWWQLTSGDFEMFCVDPTHAGLCFPMSRCIDSTTKLPELLQLIHNIDLGSDVLDCLVAM